MNTKKCLVRWCSERIPDHLRTCRPHYKGTPVDLRLAWRTDVKATLRFIYYWDQRQPRRSRMTVDKRIVHSSVTLERVVEAVKRYNTTLDNPGICILCGADADGCEPDARRLECEMCGERGVYGAEELLFHIA